MRNSNVTTNHSEIQQWVEKRGGWPAHVIGTGRRGDPGVLRIDFPGYSGDQLEEITWDEFFDKFERENLAFVFQDRKVNGETSYFNKLVSAEVYSDHGSTVQKSRGSVGGSTGTRRRTRSEEYSRH